jgi:predicted RNase H-like nuclease (RuvC/YqgF family)
MRAWISIIFLIVGIYLIAGNGYRGIVTDQQIEASVAGLKKEARDMFDATKGLAEETRDKLTERLKADLDSVRSDMKDLSKDMKKASGKEKKVLKRQLAQLEKKEKSLEKKLKKLSYTEKSFWDKIKTGYSEVMGGIKSAWNSFLSFFGSGKKAINSYL